MARTVIIGGGAIGLSVAYHLAQRSGDRAAAAAKEIVLLERNTLTSGTSWHAAGIVGPLRATPSMTRLAMYALELFPKLEAETGLSTGFRTTGGYWLAQTPERMNELQRIAALGQHLGLQADILEAQSLRDELPFLQLENYAGALSVAEDANVNPVDLCMAYARAAKTMGVQILENTAVNSITVSGNRVSAVELSDGNHLEADRIAICCGAWSKPLAATAGLELPLQAVEHMYVVTEPLPNLPDPFPVLRDLDNGIYLKGDSGGKLVLGGFEANAKSWDAFGPEGNRAFLEMPEDWDQFTPFMDAAMQLFPQLTQTGIQRFMNGPESFTMDTRPLVGAAPGTDGLFVAAGMNSVGVMSSAGIGRALADWIAEGVAPSDLWEVDVARADPLAANPAHMQQRMQEAVHDLFAMHWPYKQSKAGRNLRQSCLHEYWQQQGAVFGLTAGWERGLWYAADGSERNLPYSVSTQAWQPIAQREAEHMESGCVLLDLTPFSKFDIQGPQALEFLQQITCSSMDTAVGKCTYTAMLNQQAGIDADITVTRLAENHFRIISGAATRWRDLAALRRALASPTFDTPAFDATITDATESEAVIGVMGQASRSVLGSLSDHDWHQFAYATSRDVTIAGCPVRAQRTSFVGELGWELYVANDFAGTVFTALTSAGAKAMGHYALDSCRVEKGFCHWGHDIGPDTLLPQTGLPVRVDWSKEFIGKQALLELQSINIVKKLFLLQVENKPQPPSPEDIAPLPLHDEPVFESNNVVGLTTSGTVGVRTGLTLAFAYIDIEAGETLQQTAGRSFEVKIAGCRYKAKVLEQTPFDPQGKRMRS